MHNKTKVTIWMVLIFSIVFAIYTWNNQQVENEKKSENNSYISKKIEDECTEEYKQNQKVKEVASTEEKLSANAILILKKYYQKCEHTINEYVELPEELVNFTKKQVQDEYPDWEVIGFEKGKLTLYKEFDDVCGEHFKLRIEEGKVVIYMVNEDGTESIYEKTNISSEYLTETDLLNMENGAEIYGLEELNQIIEDFE